VADDGFIDVRFVGGPHDGREDQFPQHHRAGDVIKMPDPATVINTEPPAVPAIYSGPLHCYQLEDDATGLLARYISE
jgi:hypothetical protein